MAIDRLHGDLPAYKDIVNKPSTTMVPKSAGAICLLVYTLIQNIEEKQVDPVMTYVKRLPKEMQAMFVGKIFRSGKASMVTQNDSFLNFAKTLKVLFEGQTFAASNGGE